MKESRSALRTLTDKYTGNKPLGLFRRRCEEHILIDLKETGVNTKNWIDSAQYRDHWTSLCVSY